MKFASLCVLSYQRPEFLKRTLESLINTPAGYPYELIVHDDGSDQEVKEYLYELQRSGKISWLIINNGKNMGIGKSIQNCLRMASGDYLFKIDTDLEFEPNWLWEAVKILDNSTMIGCVSLFNYRNYNADDDRFNIIEERDGYNIVDDFVSSIYGFRRDVWKTWGDDLGADGWHQHLKKISYELAITRHDMVHNFGFGADKSIYVVKKDGGYKARGFSKLPRIFK